MANIIKKNSKIDSNIKIVSTKGFIYDYNIENDKIRYYIKDRLLYSYLKTIKSSLVYVATDHDYPGHLISLECLNILDKSNDIKRLQIPFDYLMGKNIDQIFLDRNSDKRFQYGQVKLYLKNREVIKESRKIKEESLKYLYYKDGSDIKKLYF